MILEKVIYLNIDELAHRKRLMEASFDTYGVPHTARERIAGVHGGDYASVDELLQNAPAWLQGTRNSWMGRGSIVCQWGFHKMYSAVAAFPSASQCALVLTDDVYVAKPWHEYVKLAHDLPDFDVVQLMHWDPTVAWDPLNMDFVRVYQDFLPDLPETYPCSERPDFDVGTRFPGDHGLILSREGARLLCEHFEADPQCFAEWALLRTQRGKTYSCQTGQRTEWLSFEYIPEDSYRLKLDKEA